MPSEKYYLAKNFITYFPTDGFGIAIYNKDSRDTTFFQGQNDNLKQLFELEHFDISLFQQLVACELQDATQLIDKLLLHKIIFKNKHK